MAILAEQGKLRDARDQAHNLGGARSRDEFMREKFIVSDGNKNAFEFCDAFNPKTDNLYLFGATGTGKSHLAIIAARKFWRVAMVIKPCEIFRAIRACDGAAEEMSVIGSYASQEVLVIDDLGVGKDTEFAVTSLYEIIDRRYQSMFGGLIVTTNLSPDDLAKKLGDDRIPSRLAQMCKGHVYDLGVGKDWRLA
jgi:DNA replication protein DnaC